MSEVMVPDARLAIVLGRPLAISLEVEGARPLPISQTMFLLRFHGQLLELGCSRGLTAGGFRASPFIALFLVGLVALLAFRGLAAADFATASSFASSFFRSFNL